MVKVSDYVVIVGLSERLDYKSGQVTSLLINRGLKDLVEVKLEGEKQGVNINKKYLRIIEKPYTKEDIINAALDMKNKCLFMSFTGEQND